MIRPPPIDPRDRDALLAQTTALAQRYSTWRPGAVPDAGAALIGIFARFAELVVERLNRAPERNYLAFLNLIGTQPLPPVPARVPLTFTLAEGGPGAAPVPAGTRVAAQPLPGEDEEVVFETAAPLVVTATQLTDVLVGDAENDTWSDRSTAQADAWPAFVGDRPAPHQLLLACDPLLSRPGTKDVVVFVTAPAAGTLYGWPISWSYWDGAGWTPVSSNQMWDRDDFWRVDLAGLPPLPPRELAGSTAGWIRAQLDMPLPRGRSGLAPESVAVGGRAPQDEVAGLHPFGEAGETTWFYLSVDEAVAGGGGVVQLDVTPAVAAVPVDPADPVRLVWSAKVGDTWQELGRGDSGSEEATGTGFGDTTLAMTRAGTVRFPAPPAWPRELFRGRLGRWLRVQRVGGRYGVAPRLSSLTVSYTWELPTLEAVAIGLNAPPPPEPPPAAFAGAAPLDLSADFRPFGEQPQFGETFLLACPAHLVRPGGTLQLTVTLTNGTAEGPVPQVRTAGNPRVAWEVRDGTGWRAAHVDDPAFAFTADTTVQITPPPGFAATTVHGERQHWLRVRLVGGDYGTAATYKKGESGYEPVDATFAAPVVRSLAWTSATADWGGVPATAIVSVDHSGHHVHPGPPCTPFGHGSESDPALYLGFDRRFEPRPVTLYLQVEPPAPEEVAADRFAEIDPRTRARLVWEYSGPRGWQRLDAVDGTELLSRSGAVEFVGPSDLTELERFGRRRHWVRLRWRDGQFPVVPRLRQVLPNTTWAVQTVAADTEALSRRAGGANGNRAARTVSTLNTAVPYIDAVTNHEAALGGADPEPTERLRARGPQVLRHRDRAVTAQDLEDLAIASSTEVARARAVLPSRFDPVNLWLDPVAPRPTTGHADAEAGRIGVVVVPRGTEPRPTPSLALLRHVELHLRARCPATAQLWVAGPEWVRVSVTATVVPSSPAAAHSVGAQVRAALQRYLHQETGGPTGTGWAFGRMPHRSEAFAVAEAVPGVDHVPTLRIELVAESSGLGARLQSVLGRSLAQAGAEPPAADLGRWLARALVYSGDHEITVTLGGG